jgi:hypothetical protein
MAMPALLSPTAPPISFGLEVVAEIVATGKAQPPFPQGFQALHPAADSQAILI